MKIVGFHTALLVLASAILAGADGRAGKELTRQKSGISVQITPPEPLMPERDTVTMLFAGDVMLHSMQIEHSLRKESGDWDFSSFLALMRNYISSADISVANMEFPMAGKPYSGYPSFSAPDSYAEYMAACGFDVFLTANNHVLDKGSNGLRKTLQTYGEMYRTLGTQYTGTAPDHATDTLVNPLIIHSKGLTFGIVNFTYGTNHVASSSYPSVKVTDREDIRSQISRARKRGADFVIAAPHWGIEYELGHSRSQESLAQWLCDNGADAILGSHPHVPQDVQTIQDRLTGKEIPVVYSMGNLVSNMSVPNTQVGLAVRIKFINDTELGKKMLPPEYILTWCSRPGGFSDNFTVIPIKDYLGKESLWQNGNDYENMKESYLRIKGKIGITD